MASFKKLSTPDVFVVPYTANKNWDLDFACVPQDGAYFTILKGKNINGDIDLVNGPITEGQYESLVYRQINHLYYQYHSSSILNSHSLLDSLYYESYMTESSTISTSSYFDFNENPSFVNNFPTSSNDIIRVMSFNQNIYGEQIKPNNFILTASSSYQLVDDGYGNIYDISFTGYYVQPGYYAPPGYIAELQNKVHVGNIFYSQGLVIITNQNYKCFLPTPPNAINDYFRVLNVQRVKKLDILANDYIDSCNSTALATGSVVTYPYTGYSFPDVTLITGSLFIDECETLGVTPGNYKLYYTVNDNTCLKSNTASIDLELYKLPLEISQSAYQSVVCNGGASTVGFSINYGVPPYQYSLGGGTYNNLPNCDWYQPTASVSAPVGENIFYVKDSEGTIVSKTFTVSANTFTVTTNKTDITCGGAGDGKIAVTGSSTYGAPYSASINGGSSWNGFTTNTLFSNLTPATYTVTVKDNLCSTSSLVTITQPTPLSVTINSTTADCPGSGQDIGSISITVSGGTSPYTYSWVTGSTVVRTVEDPTGLPAGTYTVTVTDANSCTATGSATISSVSLISINFTTTNSSCGAGNGQISASVGGGSGNGFSYLWNTGATGSIVTGSTGTYTLTVTDASTGCTSSGSATISSTPAVSSVSASVIYNECDSSLVVTATGGTAPYTFLVSSGSTSFSTGSAPNPSTINLTGVGLAGGTWNIQVADRNGCTASTTKVVRAREYRYSDPVCQNLNATVMVDESKGVGTNLFVITNTGNAATMVSTGYQYIQLHNGTAYTAQSPLYPPSDIGWVGNYPSASATMSVWMNGTSLYNQSTVETGSGDWLTYPFTATNNDYLIKATANLYVAPSPSPSPTYSGLIRCSDNNSGFYYVGTISSGTKLESGGVCYVSEGIISNITGKSPITGTTPSSCDCSPVSPPSSGSSPSPSGSSPSPDPGPSPSPTFYYYNMSRCDNAGTVIGKSNISTLYQEINLTYVIDGGTTCATITGPDPLNDGNGTYVILTGLTALADCNASACQSGGSGSPGGGSPGGIGGPPPESPPANPPSGGGGGDDELTPG